MVTKWKGLLAPLGKSTEDGRRIVRKGVTHRPMPLPLKWQRQDEYGHNTSVTVGSLTSITVNRDGIWGRGELFDDVNAAILPRLAEDVAEAKELLRRKVIGPSIDPTNVESGIALVGSDEPITWQEFDELLTSGEEFEIETIYTRCTVAAGTLVQIPAFAECRPFELIEPAVTAAVRRTGWEDFELADRDATWGASDAKRRLADDAGLTGDSPDWERYAEAFLYTDDDANQETKGAYKYPILDVVDGTRVIIPRAVFAVAANLEGSRTQPTIPEQDQESMREIVAGLYDRMAEEWDDPTIEAPWAISMRNLAIELNSALGERVYRRQDFELPDDVPTSGVLRMTVTDDGRVFGDVATHDVCHAGIRGTCLTAPTDDEGYREFHRYPLATDDGGMVAIGRLTYGGGAHGCRCHPGNDDHACQTLSAAGAIAHHDQLETAAYVRAWEDTANNTIRVAGVLAPGASAEAVASLSDSGRVSGDWRSVRGELRLVEVLALSRERPGYPLPANRIVNNAPMALTAAGAIHGTNLPLAIYGTTGEATSRVGPSGVEGLADAIASRVIRQITSGNGGGGVALDTTGAGPMAGAPGPNGPAGAGVTSPEPGQSDSSGGPVGEPDTTATPDAMAIAAEISDIARRGEAAHEAAGILTICGENVGGQRQASDR